MERLIQDLRYGVRSLLSSPGLTAAAIVSLALGIGANTTIFTLVNAVLLQSLPVAEPSRLVSLFTTDERNPGSLPVSMLNFRDVRDQSGVFEGAAAASGLGLAVSTAGAEPEGIFAEMVTENWFDLLGVEAVLGRTFLPEEAAPPGAHPVTVLRHSFWQRRLGGDPGVIGTTIRLNGRAFTVVGVAPEGFKGTNAIGGPELWVPMSMYRELAQDPTWFEERRPLVLQAVARLAPGVDLATAEAAVSTVGRRLAADYPTENGGRSVTLAPLAQTTINPNFRRGVVFAGRLLMSVVAIVLLIACANVANLLLARSASRRREIALRAALGAGRGRIVRQLLTESLLLSVIGGAAGLLFAFWARDLLWAFRPPLLQASDISLALDARVVLFTAALSLATGILFGLAPALQAARTDLVSELKGRSGPAAVRLLGRFPLRNALVVVQISMSLLLLVGAGLFVKSLRNAQRIDPGFDADHLVVLNYDLDARGLDEVRGRAFHRLARERVTGLGGVRAAAVAANPVFAGGGFMRTVFLESQDPSDRASGVLVMQDTVGEGYFDAVGITLRSGRDFEVADRPGGPLVAVVNEAMARRFWPGQEPIGRRFRFFGDDALIEVVGVSADSNLFAVGEEPQPIIYQPLSQIWAPAVTLHVRTDGDPGAALGSIRQAVQGLDRELLLTFLQPVSDLIEGSLWAPRMGAALLGAFGALALLLAIVGLYGVMAYSVGQRTREIGVRMALGAEGRHVLGLILRQGITLAGLGLAVGLAAALGASRLVAGALFGVGAADPATFVLTPAILLAVAAVASWIPARRATRVDPMITLRCE